MSRQSAIAARPRHCHPARRGHFTCRPHAAAVGSLDHRADISSAATILPSGHSMPLDTLFLHVAMPYASTAPPGDILPESSAKRSPAETTAPSPCCFRRRPPPAIASHACQWGEEHLRCRRPSAATVPPARHMLPLSAHILPRYAAHIWVLLCRRHTQDNENISSLLLFLFRHRGD